MDCIEGEKKILLRFKQDIIDPENLFLLGLVMGIIVDGLGLSVVI